MLKLKKNPFNTSYNSLKGQCLGADFSVANNGVKSKSLKFEFDLAANLLDRKKKGFPCDSYRKYNFKFGTSVLLTYLKKKFFLIKPSKTFFKIALEE